MSPRDENRFEDFFADQGYVSLKNHLYSYLLRRRGIRKWRQAGQSDRVLEVGSGLSPILDASPSIVYSDLSWSALRTLKQRSRGGSFVVADACHLPFRPGTFSEVICSEVLEHLPNDLLALQEIAAVLKPAGSLLLTFPHRRFYFAADDRFVNHHRRYELEQMVQNLAEAGFETVAIRKLLGPLEKITMLLVVALIHLSGRFGKESGPHRQRFSSSRIVVSTFQWLNRIYCLPVWLDACLSPRRYASVLLVRAVRKQRAGKAIR